MNERQAQGLLGAGAVIVMVWIAVSLFGAESVWNDWKSALIPLFAIGGVAAILWVVVQIGAAVERCRRRTN